MSILSNLLKIGGVVAAPFSGGASLGLTMGGGILDKLGKAGKIGQATAPILGSAAQSRANAKALQERNQLGRDNINLDAARSKESSILNRANLDLDQRKFGLAAPGQRLDTGVRGSMVSNAHNITVGSGGPLTLPSGKTINPIHFGGMGPDDLLSPEARQLGDQVTHDMLLQQMGGDKFAPLPDVSFPGATPPPKDTFTDKALGTGSTIGSILGAIPGIINIFKPKRQMSLGGGAYGSDIPDYEPE